MSNSALLEETPLADDAVSNVAGCLLCGRTTRLRLTVPGDWRCPGAREPLVVMHCDDCDFGQLQPRPTAEQLAAAYAVDEYYTHAAPQALCSARRPAERLRVRLAWSFDRGVEAEIDAGSLARHGVEVGATVCDVGCGNGGVLRRLQAAGHKVVGIEPDDGARATALAAGLNVYAGSGESLPAELCDARFDAVTMTHVLEHCLDPAAAVGNVAGLLREGGLFFVETPNNACRGAQVAGIAWRWLDVPRHLNFFTPESLQQVCRRAGLEIVAVEFTGYTRQFRADWLAEEREIARRLTRTTIGNVRAGYNAAKLFVATCCAAPRLKYDSVRVVARKR